MYYLLYLRDTTHNVTTLLAIESICYIKPTNRNKAELLWVEICLALQKKIECDGFALSLTKVAAGHRGMFGNVPEANPYWPMESLPFSSNGLYYKPFQCHIQL